ncbi:SGNH/GDSL hydrolase family protein [Butyrivibrio sp. JL13D10]|uniref:SGNH/GDSL hydrolase family protein n=1 Tax=Butyrivibrio sp. JL13D10 TaxID=3236815 RepID=UPI0038B5E06B
MGSTIRLNNEQLKNFYFGSYSFHDTEDGYLQAYQYSDKQMQYFEGAFDFWYDRCMASTAKTIEMVTDATKLSFDYKIVWIGSQDSFELVIDGLVNRIEYVKDLDTSGHIEWDLPEGNKRVAIYLPADATVLLKDFEINAEAKRPDKKERVLWLGDSITQGYGPLRSAQTYVSVANRILDYDVINQGIGGYIYDKKSLMPMSGYVPDKIIVALGTNNNHDATKTSDITEYYDTLIDLYGSDIPILCISPIWRGDNPEDYDNFLGYCNMIKKVAGSYKNVTVVDGFTLVPHLSEYFLDNLHPNLLGAETYGRNLAEVIRKKGW